MVWVDEFGYVDPEPPRDIALAAFDAQTDEWIDLMPGDDDE